MATRPYCVPNLNIEATCATIAGRYQEFASLCFGTSARCTAADTLSLAIA